MSKTTFAVYAARAVYPALALLSLASAFSAQAQEIKRDPIEQAAYGATDFGKTSTLTRAEVRAEAIAARIAAGADTIDRAGYGPTPVNLASTRTRAEVRAEGVAARLAGFDLQYREGGDLQQAALVRRQAADTAHVLAAAPAKTAAQ